MSRVLTARAKAACFAPHTQDAFLTVLELTYTTTLAAVTWYFIDNWENITIDGQEYTGFNFEADILGDDAEGLSEVQLKIDNVDRSIVQAVEDATDITTDIYVALVPQGGGAPAPTLEAGPFPFTLLNAAWTSLEVVGSLSHERIMVEPYPGDQMTPATTPALFGAVVGDVTPPSAGEDEDALPRRVIRAGPAHSPYRHRIRRPAR